MVLDANGNPLVPVALNQRAYVYTTRFKSDHSQFITTCVDGSVSLWDTNTGHLIRQFPGNDREVICTHFDRSETKLVTGATNGVSKVYELATGKCLATYIDPAHDWVFPSFSPDGTRIVSSTFGTDRQGMIWDAATGKELLSLTGGVHNNVNFDAEYSPDGKLVGICGGRFATIFDARTAQEIAVIRGNQERTCGLSFHRDGVHIFTSSNDNTVRIWTLNPTPRPLVFGDKTNPVINAELNVDAQSISVHDSDHSTKIYDISSGKIKATLNAASLQQLPADFHATGTFDPAATHTATPLAQSIFISDAGSGVVFARLDLGIADASSTMTAFTHDGRRGSPALPGGKIQIWDLTTGQSTATISTGDPGENCADPDQPDRRSPGCSRCR